MSKNIVCVDLEATCCDQDSFPRNEMEIIEIGAVVVDWEFKRCGEFQSFVRPVRNPKLTEFCKELTTITQQQVDEAPEFLEVWINFKSWLQQHDPWIWCSWGGYDLNQFKKDIDFHGLRNEEVFLKRHFNAKAEFSKQQGLRSRVGLKAAVTKFSAMDWEGVHHRASCDAKNLARLMPFIKGTKRIRRDG